MRKIRVLIADDHRIIRVGLTALLRTEKDIEVVGDADDGASAVKAALALRPDVVIMDLVMPKMDGVRATAEIKRLLPETRVLVLTTFSGSDGIAHALDAGATGALIKSADDAILITAIRKLAAGERYIPKEIGDTLTQDPPVPHLTARQIEILRYITRGFTNQDIADKLGIRLDGVEDHVNAILTKTGAANRTEAAVIALRKQLLKM